MTSFRTIWSGISQEVEAVGGVEQACAFYAPHASLSSLCTRPCYEQESLINKSKSWETLAHMCTHTTATPPAAAASHWPITTGSSDNPSVCPLVNHTPDDIIASFNSHTNSPAHAQNASLYEPLSSAVAVGW